MIGKQLLVLAFIGIFAWGAAQTFSCDGLPQGFYADPENCRKYYECEPDGTFHYTCLNDWLWDEDKDYCNYPNQVDCNDRPLCDDNDNNCAPHHTTTIQSLPQCDGFTCPDDGFYEFEDCSPIYCHCSNGIPYEEECGDGLVFNEELGGCDWDYNTPSCNDTLIL